MDLSELGAQTSGVWTRPEAARLLTPGEIQARVGRCEWQRPFRGVYADGGIELTAEQWACAATLSGSSRRTGSPAVAASGRSAARVWGMPLIDDDDPATGAHERSVHDVVARRSMRSYVMPPMPLQARGHELRRHRSQSIAEQVVRHPGGFWLTTPLATAADCASLLDPVAAVCLLDHCLHARLFTLRQIQAEIESRRGQPGARAFAAAVARADGRSESAAETVTRLLLLPYLPGLVPQVKVRDRHGKVIARVDLGDEEARFAVESDSRRWHSGEQMVAKDRRRDRRTEAHGWSTERVTWFDVRCRQEDTVRRVLAAYRLRPAA